VLGLNRSSRSDEPAGATSEDVRLMRVIDEPSTACPFSGSRRMTVWLTGEGEEVNRKRVRRLLRVMGLEAIDPTPRLSTAGTGPRIDPDRRRGATVVRPDQVGSTDIPSVPMASGFLDLAAAIDGFRRSVLTWRLRWTPLAEYSHSAPPSEGLETFRVDPEQLQNAALRGVGLSQLPLDCSPLRDDHDPEAAQLLDQRRARRCRAGTTLGVQAVPRLTVQLPAHLPLHQRQHHHRPDQDAQPTHDPLRVLPEQRRHRQRTLQVVEPTLHLARLLVCPQSLRQAVVRARQVGLQDIDALPVLPTLQRFGVAPPVEPEGTGLVLAQSVVAQRPLGGLPRGRLQAAEDRLGRLPAGPAQVPLHGLELRPDRGGVPRARPRLLPALGLAPDEHQPIVEANLRIVDRPLQVLGGLDRLILVPRLGLELGLALRDVYGPGASGPAA
jgi:HTH-like domain